MADAVRVIIKFAFDALHLHRLEAATQPANTASIRVLERNGLRGKAFARDYLRIDGEWRDHLLFGLVAPSEVGGRA